MAPALGKNLQGWALKTASKIYSKIRAEKQGIFFTKGYFEAFRLKFWAFRLLFRLLNCDLGFLASLLPLLVLS
jgi:hypothetical protein